MGGRIRGLLERRAQSIDGGHRGREHRSRPRQDVPELATGAFGVQVRVRPRDVRAAIASVLGGLALREE
eukprot:10242422-Lingulodinium_polyedra.AAC.1